MSTPESVSTRNSAPTDIFEAVTLNDENAVKNFVENGRVSLKAVNAEKQTAAHVAAQNGYQNVLKYLLKQDSTVLKMVDHYGNNVLFWAVQSGSRELVEYLVDVYELDVSERNKLSLGNTAIHLAAGDGQLQILKYFLEERYGDVNVRNDLGEPPIFAAAETTRMHVIKYLVEERNANVTATDDTDDNILYVCAKTGELAVPKYLMDERKIEFDIDHRNSLGCTVTFVAARYENLDLVKYFVEEKLANINIPDNEGITPLHEVANIGHFEVVKYLVERGADFEMRDKARNKTVLQTTTDEEILKYLKNVTLKRTARSVFELTPLSTKPYVRTRENCIESDQSETFDGAVFSKFNAWLVMANVCVGFFTRSRYEQKIDRSSMSPPEMLRRRTDPLALDAVVTPPV